MQSYHSEAVSHSCCFFLSNPSIKCTDEKVLKRTGFNLAEQRYQQMKPLLEEFEEFEREQQQEKKKREDKESKAKTEKRRT